MYPLGLLDKDIPNNIKDDTRGSLGDHLSIPKGYDVDKDSSYQGHYDFNPDAYTIPESTFSTPEMSDFYLGAIDDIYLKKLHELVTGEKPLDGREAAFYTEKPVHDKLGFNDNSAFVRVRINDLDGDWMDGGTIRAKISSIEGGSGEESSKIISEFSSENNPYGPITKDDYIYFSLYRIKSATPNKWANEENVPRVSVDYKAIPVEEIKTDPKYIYDEDNVSNGLSNFVRLGQRWHQMRILSATDGTITFDWLVAKKTGNKNEWFSAQQCLKDTIDKGNGEVYLQIDRLAGTNASSSIFENITEDKEARERLRDWSCGKTSGTRNGYCLAKQDASARRSGVAYVKIDGKWINLAKVSLTKKNVTLDNNFNGDGSKDFPQNYDIDSYIYADAFFKVVDEIDDRKKIQQKIFGSSWNALHDWTVTLGDTTLMIPPTSITVTTEVEEERAPILRAKGSMPKSGRRDLRKIMLEITFAGEIAINGYRYETEAPNGQKFIYSLNGLRALVSQFKHTPFLPIENKYLNDTLGIYAITFDSIWFSCTDHDMPKYLEAKIMMTEFDYSVYMPQLTTMCCQNGIERNWFSTAFNWPVMRYYYQKSLMKGDELSIALDKITKRDATGEVIDSGVNNPEYIKKSILGVTGLQPMQFKTSRMKFYIADDDYLNEMLKNKRKLRAARMYSSVLTPQHEQATEEVAKSVGKLYEKILSPEFQASLSKINNMGILGFEESVLSSKTKAYSGAIFNSGIYFSKGDAPDKTIDANKVLNECLGSMLEEAKSISGITKARFVTVAKVGEENRLRIGIEVFYNNKMLPSGEGIEEYANAVAPYVGEKPKSFYRNGRIFIPLVVELGESKDGFHKGLGPLNLDEDAADVKFLKYCIEEKKKDKSMDPNNPAKDGADSNGNGFTNWKKADMLAQLDMLKFVPYNVGDFVVKNFSVNLTNRKSRINIQEISGSAPQYLGGEDVEFDIEIITTNKDTVAAISEAPKRIAALMRRYREVIPACPFKVDSEFTRFLGVSEVNISNVLIETIPSQPGVFSVKFQMISADRTLRNREALEIIESENDGKLFDPNTAKQNIRSYFDLGETISKAELYPDLELPRLDEMAQLGWNFVRYKFQDSRVYVDPDFYFVYLAQLSSQMIRDMVLNSMENGVDGRGTFKDKLGAQMNIVPKRFSGFSTEDHNPQLRAQLNAVNDIQNSKFSLNAKKTSENLKKNEEEIIVEDYEGWDICNDIKAMFLEKRYKKEYDSYVAREKTETSDDFIDSDSRSEDYGKRSDEEVRTEGKWIYNKMEDARTASQKIEKYLRYTPIIQDTPNRNPIRDGFISTKKSNMNPEKYYAEIKHEIFQAVGTFFHDKDIREIFELLNFEISPSFVMVAREMVFAAACAATAEKEFSNKRKSTDWMPAPDFVGVGLSGGIQDATGANVIADPEKAIKNATEFGIFKIRQYSRKDFIAVTGEAPFDPWGKESPGINESTWLLDRCYRYDPIETIEKYKRGCINDTRFCTHAFLRNCLYWLKVLVDKQAIPSVNADILRQTINTEEEIQRKEKDLGVEDKKKNSALRDNIKFFGSSSYSLDAGKLWAAICLAGSDGNKMLLSKIVDRDYRALNEYANAVTVPKTSISVDDKVSLMMRKMELALVGLRRIRDKDAFGVKQEDVAVMHARDTMAKKYIEAAEDPKQYLVHSCHDMIVHDARGRMLRAFPTYYMLFVDEGREVGSWRLHDNFYNSMSIMEFTVVKDRKNPADTANIVMSNLYQAYSTEEEDLAKTKDGSWGDAFNSIFSPDEYAKDLEERRRGAPTNENIRLRPGARIHLRAGYGSNASMLPVIFNGVIAEVTAEDMVEIVAQGDGIELVNPIMEEEEGHTLENNEGQLSKLITNAQTPGTIMKNLLNYDGGYIRTALKELGKGHWLGDNPFGIYHFGSKEFTSISSYGERSQNIFEAWGRPYWSDGSSAMDMPNAPKITFDIFGKTVWDIANICKSVMPDFICAVTPFNMRSSIFIGAPRYYYAYDYKSINGAIQELRKPFQQFHIYTSGSDIVSNGMTASSAKIKTNASGLYQVCNVANIKEQHIVGPIFADIDIYPEQQKSMIVDTQLLAKGVPILGAAGLNFVTSFEVVDDLIASGKHLIGAVGELFGADKDNAMSSAKSDKTIAWRMTASALKDSMKEMYCGDIVLLGDPTIKPHDRMLIADNYQGLSGQVTAKEVIHGMTIDEGFTTTVSPDCINIVEDRFEFVAHNWWNTIAGFGAAHLLAGAVIGTNLWLLSRGRKENMYTLSRALRTLRPGKAIDKIKNSEYGAKIIEDLGKLGGEIKAGANDLSKKAGQKIANISDKTRAGKIVKGAGGTAKDLLSFGSKLKTIGTVGKAAGGLLAAGLATTGLGLAIEIGGVALVNTIKNFMRDVQAITIFPVKRYGIAWTAGMNGSKGAIYGAPSYDEQGNFTNLVASFLSPDNAVGGFIADLFLDEELQDIAGTLKRREDDSDELPDMLTEEKDPKEVVEDISNTFKNLLKTASGITSSEYSVQNDYRRMQILPRVEETNGDDLKQAFDFFALKSAFGFQNDPKLQYYCLISDDKRLEPYINEGFFKILHQLPNLPVGQNVEMQEIETAEGKKQVKSIEYKNDNGELVYDIPLLNREAVDILYEIVRRTKNLMPATNSSDQYEAYNETKNSFILLESATRVGDISSISSAGFAFVLRGVDIAAKALDQAIKEFDAEIAENASENEILNDSLFNTEEMHGGKVAISVRMPRVTGDNV